MLPLGMAVENEIEERSWRCDERPLNVGHVGVSPAAPAG